MKGKLDDGQECRLMKLTLTRTLNLLTVSVTQHAQFEYPLFIL